MITLRLGNGYIGVRQWLVLGLGNGNIRVRLWLG
jgi:hypothetical protein